MKKKILYSLVTILIVLGFNTVHYNCRADYPSTADYITRGHDFYNKGKYTHAIQQYTYAIRLDSDNFNAYFYRGDVYRMKGEYDLAIRDFTEAIRLEYIKPAVYQGRGYAYLGKREYDLAILDFNEVIRIAPKDSSAYADLGYTYLMKGEYDIALSYIANAIRLDSNCRSAYHDRGFVHFLLGDDTKAESDWRKAADLETDSKRKASTLENIGMIYLKQKKWKTALSHTNSVKAIREDSPWNWLFRAIAAHKIGDDINASSAHRKWSVLRKRSDEKLLLESLPKGLHVYLDKLPTHVAITR